MFLHEWRRARGMRALGTIAIVDDAPREQYLYPEFLLMQQLFATRGLNAIIVDARELTVDADALTWQGQRIDLVYNRSPISTSPSPHTRRWPPPITAISRSSLLIRAHMRLFEQTQSRHAE